MEYTYLGKTGMKVSRFCLGTMNFGPTTDVKEAFRIMDAAIDIGINFFDTADMYGFRPDTGVKNPGQTEEILGRWFKQGGSRREKVILGTKVFARMFDPVDGPNDEPGLSAFKIRRRLDASLKRLQTDHVELYQMHGYDPHCSWDELWEVFSSAISQGKTYYIGASNFPLSGLIEGQHEATQRNMLGIVSEQHKYNLISRECESEFYPKCMKLGIGLICFSPLFGGLLGGNIFKEIQAGQRTSKYAGRLSEARIKQIRAFSKLCDGLGETEAHVAQAWLLHNPAVTAPIIGPRTIEQLEDTVKAAEIQLPEDFLRELNKVFPPQGSERL